MILVGSKTIVSCRALMQHGSSIVYMVGRFSGLIHQIVSRQQAEMFSDSSEQQLPSTFLVVLSIALN